MLVCSNRAATWVNVLQAREKRQRKNCLFCRYFARSGKVQQCVVPPLHGGGRGFESPRLHSQKCRFAGQTSNQTRALPVLRALCAATQMNWAHSQRPRNRCWCSERGSVSSARSQCQSGAGSASFRKATTSRPKRRSAKVPPCARSLWRTRRPLGIPWAVSRNKSGG
jgi:hypothetical protein